MIVEELKKLYPDLKLDKVRVALDNVSDAKVVEEIVKVFDAGAVVIVSDKDVNAITRLNKVLYERSGSAFRYRSVPICDIYRQPAEVLFVLQKEKEVTEEVHGRTTIRIDVGAIRAAEAKAKEATKAAPAAVTKPAVPSSPAPTAAPKATVAPAVPAPAVKPAVPVQQSK